MRASAKLTNVFKVLVVLYLLHWFLFELLGFGGGSDGDRRGGGFMSQMGFGSQRGTGPIVMGMRTSIEPGLCQIVPINYGNFSGHIFSYVSVAVLAKLYDKQPCVSDNKYDYLAWMFDSLEVPVISVAEYDALNDQNPDVIQVELGDKDVRVIDFSNDAKVYVMMPIPRPVNLIEENRVA